MASTTNPPGRDSAESKPWYASMRRLGQVNFNETDPLTIDVDAWIDYWASLKVDAVLLGGGGIMAFYPTRVPYHHRSEFLGSRDLLGEMADAARRRGMRVVARMDADYAYQDALEAHPEWFQRNRDGSPRHDRECPWLFRTCMFSTYFTEQMPAIFREMNQSYSPDAYFTNSWPGIFPLEVCYCSNCQKTYDETGGVPPEGTDVRNPVYRKYYEVYMRRIAEIWRLWDGIVKGDNPGSLFVGSIGGVIATKDLKRLCDLASWAHAANQWRWSSAPIWSQAQNGRVMQSVMDGRTITGAISAFAGEPHWRHSSKPAAEATSWMSQVTASGMVPWYHWLGGSPLDNRWRETGRLFYDWLAENESHFVNRRSLADVAVLYPQSTISFYGSDGTRERRLNGTTIDPTDFLQGLYYSLLEGRFLFDIVHQENLTAAKLRPYRALLVPNAAYLRDSECQAIREYVASGGSLLATFETSRYDQWGEPRRDFGLADLFGVHVAGDVQGPFINTYMHIERSHPITDGFSGTEILPGANFRVPVTRLKPESTFLSVVPQYPSVIPEMVYPRTARTDEPAAVFREQGTSRIVYFPGDVDRTAWRWGLPDFNNLIRDSVRWLLGNATPTVSLEGDGLVEMFAWETQPGLALHILNYTNPHMGRPYLRQFYPIGPLRVKFKVPERAGVSKVRALRAGKELEHRRVGDVIQFVVPSVKDYEVIALT